MKNIIELSKLKQGYRGVSMEEDIFDDDILLEVLNPIELKRRKNISLAMRGKHPSEETKKKMSQKKMGNKNASNKLCMISLLVLQVTLRRESERI